MMRKRAGIWVTGGAGLATTLLLAILCARQQPTEAQARSKTASTNSYAGVVRPLLGKYCLGCHSTQAKRGALDLERFTTQEAVRRDLKPWQSVIEHLEIGDMPPPGNPQPTDAEKGRVIAWTRAFLAAEAARHAGDPGYVPLRRLSNAEYDATIRDLTGADIQPTREFPADGAGGEGFTNAAEALTDISPALLTKYFGAAKDVADHAILLPDGFRFSPTKTRRDWTNESTARLRAFYSALGSGIGPDGKLDIQPYLAATIKHRADLTSGKVALDAVASQERINPRYLNALWRALNEATPSYPLQTIRAHWRQATEQDVPALAADVAAWQAVLWQAVRVGSYVHPVGKGYAESVTRQVPVDPTPANTQPLRAAVRPAPGQNEVVLSLSTRDLTPDSTGQVVWHRPRFEAPGKPPLLLRNYAQYGPAYEADYPATFADCAHYLEVAVEAANNKKLTVPGLARAHGLDADLLSRWIDLLAVQPYQQSTQDDHPGRSIPAVTLRLLEEQSPHDSNRPAINGWRRKGADLPILVTNSSDTLLQIPGNAAPHGVMVHPTPTEFVAVTWKSPLAGAIRVAATIVHAHPACGNGVAWRLERLRGGQAAVCAEGALELGGAARTDPQTLRVEQGDQIMLAVDPKNGDHGCDLTQIGLTIKEAVPQGRTWDLASDIAYTVLAGNPHPDRYGAPGIWSFVEGPSWTLGGISASPSLPQNSLLDRWRVAAADPTRKSAAALLAAKLQSLLSGPRPAPANSEDRLLYDHLVSVDSPLLRGIDPRRLARLHSAGGAFGLSQDRFGARPGGSKVDYAELAAPSNSVIEVRLPAALFQDREFAVEGTLDAPSPNRAVAFQVSTARPAPDIRWDGKSQIVAEPSGAAYQQALAGDDQFRNLFPLFVCFPPVIPNDEVVSLKMFHREDEPLQRLFLSDAERQRIDRLWAEHRFISRQPAAENTYLPLFIGFVSQDQPKEMLAWFEAQRPIFRKRAEDFDRDELAAIPKQLAALLDFATRAFRRPLLPQERAEILGLYHSVRAKGATHEEALRGALARILVAPAYLFRIEQAPPGARPAPVNDWELATRLSYFLWSSTPDDTLRRLAAKGRLHDPQVLAAQAKRMLKDARVRALAVEFGTQWLNVRGFDELKEKNERLFPTFDANLRRAIYEESILFFQDMFQADRSVTRIIDADDTYLNETLAKHYGIPGITGDAWRRVEGVHRYRRGGVLGLASVQAKEAGASRTSPILRGNWIVETLLGEKLPRPPANVPKLPEEEGTEKLTLRQEVERHTRVPSCAVCHVRIDPYGFALERYDAIGRFRDREVGGLPIDDRTKLKDGTKFAGIDGLRAYLMTKKRQVIVRLFCRRLLGYALGRSVGNSDQPLIDEMMQSLDKHNGRFSSAVETILSSPQFRMIRGRG